jgi:calcineurin-like phosphoesterase family protein
MESIPSSFVSRIRLCLVIARSWHAVGMSGTTWYTADLHLGHQNIIRYCDRPYRSVDQMNADLVAKWNATVAPDDTVWVLGDVAMGQIAVSLPLARRLHGTKHLVAGNHDRCWEGHGARAEASMQMYRDAGFETIRSTHDIELAGRRVLLHHFPYEGDSHDDDRYVQWRPEDEGDWLFHGHVHTKWRQNGRMINVGVDVWDLAPVAQDTLLALVEAGT